MQQLKEKGNADSKDVVKHYVQLSENLSDEDQLDGDFAAEKAIEAFMDLYDKFEILATELSKPQKNQQSVSQVNPKNVNFDQMKDVLSRVIKIQAWFRKELALKNLEKKLNDLRASSNKKSYNSPEELALREFSQQLMNKNLTPEAFFRICDYDYKQTVQAGIFKDQLQKQGVKLSRGQLSRLIMILDEDMEGNITRQEYYDALEAYNVSGEKHKSLDGSLYHPFEHRALFKLIVELKKKDISYIEMFNACDVNDDRRVSITEIATFVEGLSPDIKQKELHALMNYLDIDKNGIVDKDEFLRSLNKGEQTYKQTQILNKQIAERKSLSSSRSGGFGRPAVANDNFFQEEEIGAGDQAFSPDNDFVSSRGLGQDKPPIKNSSSQPLDFETQKRKIIIEKMEKEGQNFTSFFSSLKQLSSNGLIPIGRVLKAIEVSYPTIRSEDRNMLIKSCQSGKNVDFIQLEQLFLRFSKNLKPSISQTFSILSGNIVRRMGGVSPIDSLRQFFRAQNFSEHQQISESEFDYLFSGKIQSVSQTDLDQAFKSLDTDLDGFISVSDLIDVLNSYVDGQQKIGINTKELSQIIPGFESMSPRTRCEEVISFILSELNKKNLRPLNVYKMADTNNQGSVNPLLLEQTFRKILPNIKSEIFQEAFNAFQLASSRDLIKREDFETVFSEQSRYIPNSQSLKNKMQSSTQKLPAVNSEEEETMRWIRKLDNAMLREKVSPGVAFKSADINHNGAVTVDELKESIKRLIPEETLPLVELKKIMMAFDRNRNGIIEEEEFIALIEQARNTNVTYIESPQKNRVSANNFYRDDLNDRASLPYKNQVPQRNNFQDSTSIELIVENLDKKLNLKRFFADIPMNEEGNYTTTIISKRFKEAKTLDGSTLKPSEYVPLITAIEVQQGVTSVSKVLRFLEKHSQSFKKDCLLELKYMANYIEYVKKSRNTKLFFLNNTNLQAGQRLREADLIRELSQLFQISAEISTLLLNQLKQQKGSDDVILEDLCKVIDQYRLVPVDSQQEQRQTQSKKINPQKALFKFVVKLMGLQQKKRDNIDNKLTQVEFNEKFIPFRDFFELYSTEEGLLDPTECKALFEYLRSLGKKNGIELKIFQTQIQTIQDQIYDLQEKAFGNTLDNDQIFQGLTKVKMTELGYISRSQLREHLINMGVLNRPGQRIPDSQYERHLKNLLMQDDFDIPPYLQVDQFFESVFTEESCKFWNVIEFLSKCSEKYDVFIPVIFKYLGKLFDLVAPNKQSIAAIQELCPQYLQIQDGFQLTKLIEKLQDSLISKRIGFNQDQIKENSRECLDYIFKRLGGKPLRIESEDHPLIQNINKNRALLGRAETVISQESGSFDQIVSKLEAQMGCKIEDAVESIFSEEQIAVYSMQRLIQKVSPNVDKALIMEFTKILDRQRSAKIDISKFIQAMKTIQGKYDKETIIGQISHQVEEPIQKFLEYQGLLAQEQYDQQEFYTILQKFTVNISHFHCMCIFFDIAESDKFILGKQFIQLIKDYKDKNQQNKPKSRGINDSREEKKTVRFEDSSSQKDNGEIKKLCQNLVQNYAQVSQYQVIESALKKFVEVLKPFATPKDALNKIDPRGSAVMSIDIFKQRLDSIKSLSDHERLAVAFIPLNQKESDLFQIDVLNFIKVLKNQTLDQATVGQHKKMLSLNYDAVRRFLGLKVEEVKQQEQPITSARRNKTNYADKMPNIIAGLQAVSKNQQKTQGLLDLFLKSKNQKVQYKIFYDYLYDNLGIKAVKSEFDVMKGQIDINEEGKYLLSDFLDFCARFNIDIKSSLSRKRTLIDESKTKGVWLECETLKKKITDDDFYIKGKTTILNSEEAALVMAEKLYNEAETDFFDKEFGPKDDNDEDGSRYSLYCTGQAPKGYIDPEMIEWLQPEDIIDDPKQHAMFIDDGPAPNDVRQGKLGDCWFIGALSVIATRDELLRGGIGNIVIESADKFQATNEIAEKFSQGVYPPLFHFYRKKGLYVFRFFKEFKWRYVIVDDRIPCIKHSRKPVFGQCSQLHELWVPLIEKAYAKLHGCYESLISGFIDDALTDMTGLVAEKMQLHNENKIFPHRSIKDKDTFWKYLHDLAKSSQKSMMGCSVVGDTEREIIIDGIKTGIMTGHAYGIIDVFEIKGPRKVHRLLRVRNPWGNMEWKGKWSDKSDEIVIHKKLIDEQYIQKLPEDEKFVPGVEDGTFLINYQSWRDIFNNMYICVDFPDSWSGYRYRSSWDASCSGGVPSPMTPENMLRWAKNPQYSIKSDVDFEMFVSLAQPDGRAKRENGSYLKFPYAEIIHPILFTVCELPQGKQKLDSFDKNLVKGASVLKQHREVSLRLQLPAGQYVIVPATRNPGQYGDYTLSIYFSASDDDVEFIRLDREEEYTLIQEESERCDNIQDWKLDLCEKRIKYMILQEDELNTSNVNNSGLGKSIRLSEAIHRSTIKDKKAGQAEEEYEEFPEIDEEIE